MPSFSRSGSLVVALVAASLGSACLAKSPPASASVPGRVADRRGDARASAQVPNPPDFVSADAAVVDGSLVLTVSFAPGTLSDQTNITVYLDTDEDATTGTIAFLGDTQPIGADYVIRGLTPHNPTRAALTHETAPKQSVFAGVMDVALPGPDQRRFVVPLTRLGNDDGRLRFKLDCDQIVASSAEGQKFTSTMLSHLDQMPDLGALAGVVR